MMLLSPHLEHACVDGALVDADENVDEDDAEETCELASSSPSSFESLKIAAARAAAADVVWCGRWLA